MTPLLVAASILGMMLVLVLALCKASGQGSRDSEWWCVTIDQEQRQRRRVK